MRLAYVCKVKDAIIFWEETSDREAMYWPKGQDLDEDIADSLGPITKKRKIKKVPKVKEPEPEVQAVPSIFTIPDDVEPVWSVDSTGELGCVIDGQYALILSSKHAASLNRFMKATEGAYATKDSDVI